MGIVSKYYENLVYIEDTADKIFIVDLETGTETTYNAEYYHLWWATYMNKNFGALPLYLTKTQDKICIFLRVDGYDNGSPKKVHSLKEARAYHLKII